MICIAGDEDVFGEKEYLHYISLFSPLSFPSARPASPLDINLLFPESRSAFTMTPASAEHNFYLSSVDLDSRHVLKDGSICLRKTLPRAPD